MSHGDQDGEEHALLRQCEDTRVDLRSPCGKVGMGVSYSHQNHPGTLKGPDTGSHCRPPGSKSQGALEPISHLQEYTGGPQDLDARPLPFQPHVGEGAPQCPPEWPRQAWRPLAKSSA